MGSVVIAILGLIEKYIKPITAFFASLLAFQQGLQVEKKKALEEHIKDATESQKLSDNLASSSDADIDSILSVSTKRRNKSTPK